MASAVALTWNLLATDAASPVFNRVGAAATRAAAATEKASATTSLFGKKMAVAIGAIGIADLGVHAVKAAADFQRSMLLIQTQAGASAGEVKKMTGALLDLAPAVGTGPEALATSLYHVESVGLRGAKALDVVKIAAEGAKVGNANLEETTNALTSAVASGIPGVQSMTQAMGALNAIVGAGDMNLSQLNEALGTGILTKAKTFGLSLTDVGAALATLGDLNIRGAEAATQLRMGMEAMAKPVGAGVKTLASWGLGVKTLRDDMQKGGLNLALKDLKSHLDAAGITGTKVGGALLDAFGKKGASGVTLLLTNFDRFQLKLRQVHDGASKFGDAWAATSHTAAFAFDQIRAGIEAVGIKIGLVLLPVATVVFGGIAKVVGALNGTLGKLVLIVLGAWAAIRLGTAAVSIFQTIALKAMYAKDAMVGMSTASLGLGATLGIAAAAAAIIVVSLNAFADAHRTVAAGADASAKTLGQYNKTGQLTSAMLNTLGVASGHLGSVMENAFSESNWTSIKDFQFGLGSIIHTPFNSATDDAKNFFKSVNGGLKEMLAGGDLSGAKNIINKLAKDSGVSVDKLESKMPGLKQAFADAAASVALMSTAQAKQIVANALADTSATATVTTLAALAVTYGLTAKQAQTYADMIGLTADRINAGQVSSKQLSDGIREVSRAYNGATVAGSEFLAALATFSQSAGTSADRAALIGATLKANAGDALSFAAAMNGAAVSVQTLGTNVAASAKAVGKSGESTRTFLASIVNLKNGSIDYHNTAAAPLIADLQSIQTSAINAATATYQHDKALFGGKVAADHAVAGYQGVEDSLTGQFVKLHLTKDAAQKLTQQYLGVPSKVKTLIEQAGANPVVDVLNRIGAILAQLAGVPWTVKVDAKDHASPKAQAIQAKIDSIRQNWIPGVKVDTYAASGQLDYLLSQLNAATAREWTITVNTIFGKQGSAKLPGMGTSFPSAAAGTGPDGLPPGWSTVGERGWEGVYTAGGKSQVIPHEQAMQIMGLPDKIPGFASGTGGAPTGQKLTDVVSAFAALAAAAHNILSTAADLNTAALAMKSTAKAAGASAGYLRTLATHTARLVALGRQRDTVAARLGTGPSASTAYDRLGTAQGNLSGSRDTIRSASMGSFDVTTAGASVYNDVAGGSASAILAQLTAAAAKAKTFGWVLYKLRKAGLPLPLFEQLANAGPSALPQAQALMAATPAEMLAVGSQYQALTSASAATGKYVSAVLYQPGVTAAQGLVDGLLSQQSTLNAAIKTLGDGMVAQLKTTLHIKSPSMVMHGLGLNTAEGYRLGIAAKRDAIAREGARMAHGITSSARSGGSGTVINNHWEIHPAAQMDEQQIAAIASRRMAALVY